MAGLHPPGVFIVERKKKTAFSRLGTPLLWIGRYKRTYNPGPRLPGVAAYDAAGNQTSLSGASSPYLNLDGTFSYDRENRLLTANLATPVSYAYDGEGRRVQENGRDRQQRGDYDLCARRDGEPCGGIRRISAFRQRFSKSIRFQRNASSVQRSGRGDTPTGGAGLRRPKYLEPSTVESCR